MTSNLPKHCFTGNNTKSYPADKAPFRQIPQRTKHSAVNSGVLGTSAGKRSFLFAYIYLFIYIYLLYLFVFAYNFY